MASRSQRKLRAEFRREMCQLSPEEDRTFGFLTGRERRRFNPIASVLLPCCCLGHPRIVEEDDEDHLRPRRATPSTARRPPTEGSWVVEEGSDETELKFPPLNYGEDGLQAIHGVSQEFRSGETVPTEGGSPVGVITAKNWSNLTGATLPASCRVPKTKSSRSGRKSVACSRTTEVPESEDLSALEKSKTSRAGRARKWLRGFLKGGRGKVLRVSQAWSGVEERGAGENGWIQNRSQQGNGGYDRLSLTSSVITDDFEEYISLGTKTDEVHGSEKVRADCEDVGRGGRPGREKEVSPGSAGRGESSCLRQSDGIRLANDSQKSQMRPADAKKTTANEDAKSLPTEDHSTVVQDPYCPPCVYKTQTGAKVILIHVQPVKNQPGVGRNEFRGFGTPVKPESPSGAISENKHGKIKTLSSIRGEEMKNSSSVAAETTRKLGDLPEAKRSTVGVKKAINQAKKGVNQVEETNTSKIREVLVSKVPTLPTIQGDRKRSSQPKEVIGSSHKEKDELTERQREDESQPKEVIGSSHKEECVLTERQKEDEAQKIRNLEILAGIRERSKRLGSLHPNPPAQARPLRSSQRPPAKVASLPVTIAETPVSELGVVKELYEENCRNSQMFMNRLATGQGFGEHVPGKQSRPSPGGNGSDMQQQPDILSCCQQMLESNGTFQEEIRQATISVNKKWIEMKKQRAMRFAANQAPCQEGASHIGKGFTGSREGRPFHHKEREGPRIQEVNDPNLEGEDGVYYRGRLVRFCWPHPKDTVKRTQMARRKHGKKKITVASPIKLPQITEEPVDNNKMIQTNLKQKCQERTDRRMELADGTTVDQNYPGTPYPKPTPSNQLTWAACGTLSDPRSRNYREKNTDKVAVLRAYHTAISAIKLGMRGPEEMVDSTHGEEDGIELIEL
ncbi:uncharacterized protein [Asterias amurensis]|uniref:uncharacterized protein n=1 Tax=Asterias amurensis TaxID=7602 RepID=UPI003AB5BFE9